jgi:hypothetical protein
MATSKPTYKQLPVQLTEAEKLERASKAAGISKKYCEVEAVKKERTSELGRELKTLRAEKEQLLEAVRTGIEIQHVEIEERRNDTAATIDTYRLDTGEKIFSRPQTPDERQGKLFGLPGGKAPMSAPKSTKKPKNEN